MVKGTVTNLKLDLPKGLDLVSVLLPTKYSEPESVSHAALVSGQAWINGPDSMVLCLSMNPFNHPLKLVW